MIHCPTCGAGLRFDIDKQQMACDYCNNFFPVNEITDNTGGSFILQWHITHRCNLRCTHCYQDDYTAFETKDDLFKVLDQYEELLKTYNYKGFLNVTGGEPLTHPELYRLLSEARRRGIVTAVLTNGTLIGRREAFRLKSCGVDYVQVSLDGTQKVHDSIRGKGSFKRAVQGIMALRAENIFVTVSFTAQRKNLRELPGLARFCRDLDVNKLWYDRVIIPEAEDNQSLTLTTKDFVRLSGKAAKLNKNGMVSCARALQFLPCDEKQIYRCTAGERLITVLADGSVMACRRLPVVSGKIHDSDLLTVFQSHPDFVALRNSPVPKQCEDCKYALSCSGGAKCVTYAKFGRYDLPDPNCPLLAE